MIGQLSSNNSELFLFWSGRGARASVVSSTTLQNGDMRSNSAANAEFENSAVLRQTSYADVVRSVTENVESLVAVDEENKVP